MHALGDDRVVRAACHAHVANLLRGLVHDGSVGTAESPARTLQRTVRGTCTRRRGAAARGTTTRGGKRRRTHNCSAQRLSKDSRRDVTSARWLCVGPKPWSRPWWRRSWC
jgi:hypothetical protein